MIETNGTKDSRFDLKNMRLEIFLRFSEELRKLIFLKKVYDVRERKKTHRSKDLRL